MRYVFGPEINGVYPRPEVPGELPDLSPTASVKEARASANPGEVDIDVAFEIPPHDASAVNPLRELHAVHFAPGHGVPTDPSLAIGSSQPKASQAITTDLTAGGEVLLTITGAPAGAGKIKTVFGYDDAPKPADPATTPAAS